MKTRPLEWRITETGCHEPTSHKSDDGHGYPQFVRGGKPVRIYRYQFEARYGPVPSGLVIRHTCDNRKCINTDHMLLGTRADNMHDRTARGRTGKGELNGHAKIIEADARYILASNATTNKLAELFRVTPGTIRAIKTGRRWKHLQTSSISTPIPNMKH